MVWLIAWAAAIVALVALLNYVRGQRLSVRDGATVFGISLASLMFWAMPAYLFW